jgi:RNA polymerase sigma-32 factor
VKKLEPKTKIPEVLEKEINENTQDLLDESVSADHDDIIDLDLIASNADLEILKELLPVVSKGNDLVSTVPAGSDPLKQYLKEISRHKLLSREEEADLTKKLYETGDIVVAKKLVMANLRLVVKIAMEYRSAYKNVMDLIQEGNIGLMKAVSKYNPEKGAKLSYYASWWIKSYILKFILDNFKLIKIGTTAEQKKLFYNLIKEKDRLKSQGIEPDVKLISENLGVSEKSVKEMDLRLGSHGAEVSIDTPVGSESSSSTLNDFIEGDDEALDDVLANQQGLKILEDNLGDFLQDLKPRDQDVFKKRLLSEMPPSLQSIADDYGVSRERIRQIEARLLEKLKVYMSDFIR